MGASFPRMLHELHVASKRRWTWIYGDEANAGGLNKTQEFLRPKMFLTMHWSYWDEYIQHTLIEFASCFLFIHLYEQINVGKGEPFG